LPISNEEHLEDILGGLSEDYESFIMFVTSRLDPYIVANIKALLAQEERLEKYRSQELHLVYANFASTLSIYVSLSRPIPGSTSSQNRGFHHSPRNNNPTSCYSST